MGDNLFHHPSVLMTCLNKRQLVGLLMHVLREYGDTGIEVDKEQAEAYFRSYSPMIFGKISGASFDLSVYTNDEVKYIEEGGNR